MVSLIVVNLVDVEDEDEAEEEDVATVDDDDDVVKEVFVVVVVVVVEDDVDGVIKVLVKSKLWDEFNDFGCNVNDDDDFNDISLRLSCDDCCFIKAKEDFFDMALFDVTVFEDDDDEDDFNNDMGDHKNKFIFLNNFEVWLVNDADRDVVDVFKDVLLEAFNFTAFTKDEFKNDADDLVVTDVEEILLFKFKE